MFEDDTGRQMNSSFDGNISEIPEIRVDNFEHKNKDVYFLSHAHSDHTVDLFGNFNSMKLRENGAKIYMSEETQTIIAHNHWYYDNLEGIVEPLKPGFTYRIDLPDYNSFQVTLIPVRHMIGAVMFLFKTKDKTILYTGDFVMTEDEVSKLKRLHGIDGNPITIDALYVDATFDNPDYDHFPSREAGEEQVVEKAEAWLADGDSHRLALYSRYQFGYDDIYSALHNKLKLKTFAKNSNTRERQNLHELYEKLYGVKNFTTEIPSSKIHMCKSIDNTDHVANCHVESHSGLRYLHIRMSAASGYYYDPEVDAQTALTSEDGNKLYLCYPTHCSRSQLNYFINYFNPGCVTRFPKNAMSTPTSGRTPYKKDRHQPRPDGSERVKRHLFQ